MGCGSSAPSDAVASPSAPAQAAASPSPTQTSSAAGASSSPAAGGGSGGEERATPLAGQALGVASALVDAGSNLAARAGSALKDAQASATYRGLDGSTPAAGAKAMLDTIAGLSGSDDAKKLLGASWVLVSESAKFFTVGKVAVALLEQMYSMWNAWDSKNIWVGSFVAFLQLVESDLVAGQEVFKHLGALRNLEKQLEQARDLVSLIVSRRGATAFIFALYDEQKLQEQQKLIEERKQECLFGHAVDIKGLSAQNLALVDRLAELVRLRQSKLAQFALYPEGLEARGKRMRSLAEEFGLMDMSSRTRGLIDQFVRTQRNHVLNSGDDAFRAKYVAFHWGRTHVQSPALDLAQAGAEELDDLSATREKRAFELLSKGEQSAQLSTLRSELASAVEDALSSAARSDHNRALERIKQGRSLLASLRLLVSDDEGQGGETEEQAAANALADKQGTQMLMCFQRVRAAQIAEGSLLPALGRSGGGGGGAAAQYTLDQLLAFRPVTPSERQSYTALFERAYAEELTQVRAFLALDGALQRSAGFGAKQRLLAIRAPAPVDPVPGAAATTDDAAAQFTDLAAAPSAPSSPSSAAASSSTALSPADTACVSTSIFLAFLSESNVAAVRALHFLPDRATRAREVAARAARKAERESARAVQRRAETLAQRDGWKARNAARAVARAQGDYASDDEEEPASDPLALAHAEALARIPETAEETADAEREHAERTGSSGDAAAAGDLRRVWPSIALQLSQALPTYYSNLLSLGPMLTRQSFAGMNSSDFVQEIFLAPLMKEGSAQNYPGPSLAAESSSSSANGSTPAASSTALLPSPPIASSSSASPSLSTAASTAAPATPGAVYVSLGSTSGAAREQQRVVFAIDGAHWNTNRGEEDDDDDEGDDGADGTGTDRAGGGGAGYPPSFLAACSKLLPRLPAWMGALITLPPSSPAFDRRVLAGVAGVGALSAVQLRSHALSDLSRFAEPLPAAADDAVHADMQGTASGHGSLRAKSAIQSRLNLNHERLQQAAAMREATRAALAQKKAAAAAAAAASSPK